MAGNAVAQKTLVLALGNELIADDAIGIVAARQLETMLEGRAEVIATSEHGVALLDLLIGYEKLVLIDAILTGEHPAGTVFEIDSDSLRPVAAPSPHFTGVPELIVLAKQLDVPFPGDIRIIAVEVADLSTLGGSMTDAVEGALGELCERVCDAVG